MGPPIVFVHGSVSTYTDWMPVAHLLAPRFTCYAMDRRGRNRSGDGAAYSIEREYEDVLAVLAAAGPGAFLAGHSYGAICALGAALRRPVPRMVIYEPPFSAGGPTAVEHVVSYRRAIEEGNTDRAVEIIFRHFIRLSEDEIAAMRHTRAWSHLRHLAPTWVRETRGGGRAALQRRALPGHYLPHAHTRGRRKPGAPLAGFIARPGRVLPNGRVVRLPGQSHFAMRAAPELVAGVIGEFLRDGDD